MKNIYSTGVNYGHKSHEEKYSQKANTEEFAPKGLTVFFSFFIFSNDILAVFITLLQDNIISSMYKQFSSFN